MLPSFDPYAVDALQTGKGWVKHAWLRRTFSKVVALSIFSEKILSQIYQKHPETANVPEDGATLHVQNSLKLRHLPHFKFEIIREMIFGHQNFDEKGFGRSKLSFEGKKTCIIDCATTWDSAIQLLWTVLQAIPQKGITHMSE